MLVLPIYITTPILKETEQFFKSVEYTLSNKYKKEQPVSDCSFNSQYVNY